CPARWCRARAGRWGRCVSVASCFREAWECRPWSMADVTGYRRHGRAPNSRPLTRAGRSVLAEPLHQRRLDDVGDEAGDVPAELPDLLHLARREECELRIGRHEERLDARYAVVHLGHLQLVLVVADGPEPADDDGDVLLLAVVHRQAVERVDADVAVLLGGLGDHLGPFLDGEQALLVLVDQHGDDHLVVQTGGAADDVEMPVGDGVERSRTDGTAHGANPFGPGLTCDANVPNRIRSTFHRPPPNRAVRGAGASGRARQRASASMMRAAIGPDSMP